MINEENAREAIGNLQKYKAGKQALDMRLIDNEQWWKLRHWEQLQKKDMNPETIEPASAWLFNSIINKHADFMDNYPEANILPREESDEETAKILSKIVPYVIEKNDYEKTYSNVAWQKLKTGTGIYGVFWDSSKENGLGDITIRKCDPLRMYWEPGIEDIQESKNLFYLDVVDNDVIRQQFPFMEGKLDNTLLDLREYIQDDYIDNSGKSIVIDWYYKKTVLLGNGVMSGTKTVLHYCKICNGKILFASENTPGMENGWYEHGKYPFVLDPMFPTESTPFGFGYLDIMKDCQMYIDKMGQAILKNTIAGSHPRYLSKDGAGVNEEEFTDLSKDVVHYTGSKDAIEPIKVAPLSSIHYQVYQGKIEELKETSGNRDFSQGSTSSGVTAASAIAALQEAGSKLSRDMIKSSFRAHKEVTYVVLELIRQFYTAPRTFRITGKTGVQEYVRFDNGTMTPQPTGVDFTGAMAVRMPVYDIVVTAQKASPFTKIAQNELAKEIYKLGFFNPQLADQALACLDMMMFDGKEEVVKRISENGTMYMQLQQMQQTMTKMAEVIARFTGDSRLLDVVGLMGLGQQETPKGVKSSTRLDDFGNATKKELHATAGKARERAASAATPKGAS